VVWLADLRRPWWRRARSNKSRAVVRASRPRSSRMGDWIGMDWEGTHLIGEVKLGMGEATNTSGSLHSIWRSRADPYLRLRLTQLQLLILPDYAFDSPMK
jgi:hypothetical protein